jgi:hypothetical protein
MKAPSADPARARDAASLLPVLGVFLLMPPIITLFAARADVAGVPLIVVYLFGVWLALIACAALLARRLALPAAERRTDAEPDG